ncbi:MAG: GNAT family N-acetyltransferase [Lachnospiraceae bacterium]|nr:GNAT family N-acetyltransferase [Lachnospiraceae bacterium]
MKIKDLSKKYRVRKLSFNSIEEVYHLCSKNTMYYEYCPPFITMEGVKEDMEALPPGKTYEDKYFIGYYEKETLIAIMDLIAGYPNDSTSYIDLFMMNVSLQGKGIGTTIILELCDYCKAQGYERNLSSIQ